MKKANKNLLRRFLASFLSANASVLADIAAIVYTYKDCHFCFNLALYQVTRKLSWEGIKPAIVAFLVTDPYIIQRFPPLVKMLKVVGR